MDIEDVIQSSIPWEKFKNKHILITGANGFLPAYLVYSLLEANEIFKLDLKITALVRNLEKAKIRFSDFIKNESLFLLHQDVNDKIENKGYNFIIHAASQASPKYYSIDPVGTLKPNIIGTTNLLELAVESKVEAFLYFSSSEVYGAKAATKNLHPIVALGAENCTEQLGIDGPWYERMPHFKMGFTPSSGEELQAEYFVPFESGLEALLAIEKQKERIYPLLLISEIRTIAADSFWMSPCYQQPCLSIHFTLKPDWEGVKKLLPIIERELEPFRVKPHWGKLFTIPSNVLASRYEKMPDFIKLLKSMDPDGKFRNDFLDTYIYSNDLN